jgi:hypothetical protein
MLLDEFDASGLAPTGSGGAAEPMRGPFPELPLCPGLRADA